MSDSMITFVKTYALAFITVFIFILRVIAWWKLFAKAGVAGWKSLIPIYNSYLYYKIAGVPSLFWIAIVVSVMSSLPNATIVYVSLALTVIIVIYQNYALSKAFGHGFGYTLGLLFLNLIFTFILGFGSSTYQLEKKKN